MEKILEKIEKEIKDVKEKGGFGEVNVIIQNGKVCFINQTKKLLVTE